VVGYAELQTYNADVYVFCVHEGTAPLDVGSWTFWVLPQYAIAGTGSASLSLTTVDTLASTHGRHVTYGDLAVAIDSVANPTRQAD
jgi:hypothetical protein